MKTNSVSKRFAPPLEKELLAMLEERRPELLDRVALQIMDTAKGDFEAARHATEDALD